MNLTPMPGMVVVEELGPAAVVSGRGRIVLPETVGRGTRNMPAVRRAMRGRVVSCGVEVSRGREAVAVPPVGRGAVVWYYDGAAKAGYEWREGGRKFRVFRMRELICEEEQ